MNGKLEFQNAVHKDWQIFSVKGHVDTVTSPQLEKATGEVLQANEKVALNMSEMDYISSAGLRTLLRLAKQAKRDNKKFVFFGANAMIKEIFDSAGMDRFFTIYETIEDLP